MRAKAALPLCLLLLAVRCGDGTKSADAGAMHDAQGPLACTEKCLLSLVAGEPGGAGAANGAAMEARFSGLVDIAGDGQSIYLADGFNGAIRRFNLATGRVDTLAGELGAQSPTFVDGPGAEARFGALFALELLDGLLYATDWNVVDARLRRIDPQSGDVSSVRDSKGEPFRGNGLLSALAADDGVLYVASPTAIWRFAPGPDTIELLAGDTAQSGTDDGAARAARFLFINGLAAVGSSLYVADLCRVRKLDLSSRVVTTAVGSTSFCLTADGSAGTAGFAGLQRLARAAQAPRIFATDTPELFVTPGSSTLTFAPSFGRVRSIATQDFAVRTEAGTLPGPAARVGESGGEASTARLLLPTGLWSASDERLYLASSSALWKLEAGQVTLVAGSAQTPLLLLDGVALAANEETLFVFSQGRAELLQLSLQSGSVAVRASYDEKTFPLRNCRGLVRDGNKLYCADLPALRVYDLATGVLGELLDYRGGSVAPRDLVLDVDGRHLLLSADVVVGQQLEHRIFRVDPSQPGMQPETLHRSQAFSGAKTLAVAAGALYLASSHQLARVDLQTGELSLVAGSTEAGCETGPADRVRFRRLAGMAPDGQGGLYLGDKLCHQIVHLDLKSGATTLVAGSPQLPSHRLGRGASAGIGNPTRLVYAPARRTLYAIDGDEGVVVSLTSPLSQADGGVSDQATP